MRRYIQKKISELISTVNEALIYINNGDSGRENIFNDCVDAICAISGILEEQQLNEDRRQIYEQLFSKIIVCMGELKDTLLELKDVYSATNEIISLLDRVKQNVNSEEIKLEILFLPYKASMWDSMESIWEAAKDDKKCECFVVPIPYYDKSDGKFTEFKYEGNELKKDIPIVHYDDYNITERFPDIVYIHNPYDDCNIVTSVEPRFYSKELKEYTDNLVYVPYFIAGSYSTLNSACSSVMAAGIKNADYVIAQSEVHEQIFIKAGYSPNKILALGSPKIDAALKVNSDYYRIPQEWKDKLEEKKVILYNSSITNLLVDRDSLKKLDQELEKIINNPLCGVIWRPHPLLEATIIAMRDDLHKQYIEMKSRLLKKSNVIIDESSDVYPAIQVSDALISDYSSIMFQYGISGKPVLSIDVDYGHHINYGYQFLAVDYFSYYFMNPWKPLKDIECNNTMSPMEGTSIEEFVQMIIEENDYKKEQRLYKLKESLINTNGTCGQTIHRTLMQKVLEDK